MGNMEHQDGTQHTTTYRLDFNTCRRSRAKHSMEYRTMIPGSIFHSSIENNIDIFHRISAQLTNFRSRACDLCNAKDDLHMPHEALFTCEPSLSLTEISARSIGVGKARPVM